MSRVQRPTNRHHGEKRNRSNDGGKVVAIRQAVCRYRDETNRVRSI